MQGHIKSFPKSDKGKDKYGKLVLIKRFFSKLNISCTVCGGVIGLRGLDVSVTQAVWLLWRHHGFSHVCLIPYT